AFADFYATIYQRPPAVPIDEVLKHTRKSTTPLDRLNDAFTVSECMAYFQKVSNKKSGGPDSLTTVIWKHLIKDDDIQSWIVESFNIFFHSGLLPNSWKEGHTVPLYKDKGDRFAVENYRPISLLNLDYRAFTHVLAKRVIKVSEHIIPQEQTGYIPKRNC